VTRLNLFLKYLQKEQLNRLFFFFIPGLLVGCGSGESHPKSADVFQAKRLQLFHQTIYPQLAKLAHNGDIVTRLGSDITSDMLRQMNRSDQSFSHLGIASIEHDTIFVYHAIGGEFNPDQKIKREPLYSFLHAADNKGGGLFRINTEAGKSAGVALMAKKYFDAAIPFDMAFDYQTEDRLYCAEFVAKCIGRTLKDSSWLSFSKAEKFSYVAVDNITTSKIMQPVVRKFY
jgi:hypothetical protein